MTYTPLITGLFSLSLLAGCQSSQRAEVIRYDEFPSNYESNGPKNVADAQAAAGNRADATLRAAHFDGSTLNSLGQAKLASMLKSEKGNVHVAVYLDVPADTLTTRKAAVTGFLKDKGVEESQIALTDGANPNVGGTSASGLKALEKMGESKDAEGMSSSKTTVK